MMEMCDIAMETLEVLKYFDAEFTSKISKSFLDSLKELSSRSKAKVEIDVNKKLINQNISEESKNLISIIYYNYFADENEKKKIIKIWKENEKKFPEKVKKIYDANEIFNKKIKNSNTKIDEIKGELPVISKKNWIEKIIEKIKNLFRK